MSKVHRAQMLDCRKKTLIKININLILLIGTSNFKTEIKVKEWLKKVHFKRMIKKMVTKPGIRTQKHKIAKRVPM